VLINHKVQEGDTCGEISVQYSITLNDLYFLNSMINTECTNLWVGSAYCIKAVGQITTYPGYPISSGASAIHYYTLTAETYTTESWATVTTTPSFPAATAKSLAPGSWSNCSGYHDGVIVPTVVDQTRQENKLSLITHLDTYCNSTAAANEISLGQLLKWNPSLVAGNATGNCTLLPDYKYCVNTDPICELIPSSAILIYSSHHSNQDQCLLERDTIVTTSMPRKSCPEPFQHASASTHSKQDIVIVSNVTLSILPHANLVRLRLRIHYRELQNHPRAITGLEHLARN
jgi:hypothetical protein